MKHTFDELYHKHTHKHLFFNIERESETSKHQHIAFVIPFEIIKKTVKQRNRKKIFFSKISFSNNFFNKIKTNCFFFMSYFWKMFFIEN